MKKIELVPSTREKASQILVGYSFIHSFMECSRGTGPGFAAETALIEGQLHKSQFLLQDARIER